MALENLYLCTPKECEALPQLLSEGLFEDPLYEMVFPDPATRKQATTFFLMHYLEMLSPYIQVLADGEKINGFMIIFDSRRYERKQYTKRVLEMDMKLLALLRTLKGKGFYQLVRQWDQFSGRWVKDFERKDYFHLYFLCTKDQQGTHRIAQRMIKELLDEGDIMDMDVSVATHRKEMALWYEKMGFVLMNTVVDEESGLHQYCLIGRPHKEQKSWIQNIG